MIPAASLDLGIGTWKNTDPAECRRSIVTALELGYRHLDTAQAYDNEEYVGAGIAAADVPREDVFLATKVWTENLRYEDVLSSTKESLERLSLDYVDLLYVHWPEDEYDAADTLPAFDELVERDLVKRVGVSNFTVDQLAEARNVLDAPIFAHQVEMHPLFQQEVLLADARKHGELLVAYCPLARGEVFEIPELNRIAEKHDASEAQVSLSWLAGKDGVAVIPKATGDHIGENFEALSLDLDDEDVALVESIEREKRLVTW